MIEKLGETGVVSLSGGGCRIQVGSTRGYIACVRHINVNSQVCDSRVKLSLQVSDSEFGLCTLCSKDCNLFL